MRGRAVQWVFHLSVGALVTLLLGAGMNLWMPSTSFAVTSIPAKINFQGRLTNSTGNVLADGSYNMRLRLYSALTGGAAVWSEDRLVSATNGVTVTNGLFSIRLGDVTTIPASLFNNQTYANLYFEVELPTPATATSALPTWTEGAMTPRNPLASSAYSFNSETLDGLDSSAFAQIGSSNVLTGLNTFRNSTNSTASFAIQDSSGVGLLSADSINDRIVIGEATADSNTTFLAVDSYNGGSSDPAGMVNGSIYYNTTLGKFRCYENSTWKDCITAGGGGGGGDVTVKVTSDVVNNNVAANTLANVTGLSFTANAGSTYRFRAFIEYSSAATTTGSRWTVTGPTSSYSSIRSVYTLTATTDTNNYVTGYNLPAASNATSLTAGNIALVEGRIRPTATGTFQVQFASEVALSAITAKAGSTLTYWID